MHGFDHDEAFGPDAALPGIDQPALGANAGRQFEVGVFQNEIGVATAEFEHGLFDQIARFARDGTSGLFAAGQGGGPNLRMLQELGHPLAADREEEEEAFREAGIAEQTFNGPSAAAHIGGVLEQSGISGHQGRRREAEHLPEGEIPRHDRQHDPDRIEAQVAQHGLGLHPFGRQEVFCVIGIIAAQPGTFGDLAARFGNGFSHFQRDEAGEFFLPFVQKFGGTSQGCGAFGNGGFPPFQKGQVALIDSRHHFGVGRLSVAVEEFVRGGIDGAQ